MSKHLSALLALGLACLAPARQPRRALHRHRDDEAPAPGRPAGLARRLSRGLRPHRGRPRRGQAQHRPLARPRGGGRAAADHVEPRLGLAPAVEPGRGADRLPLRARRLFAGVGARPRRRRAAQAHLARDRRGRLRVDRREAPARGRRGLPGLWRRRRVQREGAGRGGQAFLGARLRRPPLPPLGHLGRRAAQPPPRGADRRRSRDRPHPGRRRRSALQPRGRGLVRVARRTGGLLLAQGPEGRGLEHECRRVRRAHRRRHAEAGLRRGGLRRRLPLQPGRQPPRLALAAAGRLRGRPLAAGGPWTARPAPGGR